MTFNARPRWNEPGAGRLTGAPARYTCVPTLVKIRTASRTSATYFMYASPSPMPVPSGWCMHVVKRLPLNSSTTAAGCRAGGVLPHDVEVVTDRRASEAAADRRRVGAECDGRHEVVLRLPCERVAVEDDDRSLGVGSGRDSVAMNPGGRAKAREQRASPMERRTVVCAMSRPSARAVTGRPRLGHIRATGVADRSQRAARPESCDPLVTSES